MGAHAARCAPARTAVSADSFLVLERVPVHSKELDRIWKEHNAEVERSAATVITVLVITIYASWACVDYVLEHDRLADMLPWRFAVVGLAAVCMAVVRRARSIAVIRAAMAGTVLAGGVLVAYFTVIVDHVEFYTVAFSLVFWGFGLMLRWHWRLTALCFTAIHGIHLVLWLCAGRGDATLFATFYVYLVTTGALSVTVGAVRWRLQRLAFLARLELAGKHAELAALIGNTTSAIWSVDRQLHPIASNAVFATRFCRDQRTERWRQHYERALGGMLVAIEVEDDLDGTPVILEVGFNPIRDGAEITGVAVFAQDITARKAQDERLARVHRELVTASRLAGMADVASDVLHNVGNALNSAVVSARTASDRVHKLKLDRLSIAGELLLKIAEGAEPMAKLGQVGQYLKQLETSLGTQRASVVAELESCITSLERVASAVAAQEAHATSAIPIVEEVTVEELLATAVELSQPQLGMARVEIASSGATAAVRVERFKLLRILSNLILHIAQALVAARVANGVIRVAAARREHRLMIEVGDRAGVAACGDPAELFRQNPERRGADLHWAMLATRQLGGELRAEETMFHLDLKVA
jgi:two-component system, LuxR family, sensor kinase FixL